MPLNSCWTPVTAPGLPPLPRLYVNRSKKRAFVRVRIPTWRSWERARITTTAIGWGINLYVLVRLWNWFAFPEPALRIVLTVFGFCFCALLTRTLLPIALEGFLARQLFPSTTKFWFRPDAIAIRSHLFETGIVIWRYWKRVPVLAKFDIMPDPDAADDGPQPQSRPYRSQHPRRRTARILRLIVATPTQNQMLSHHHSSSWMRAIPLLELDESAAARITVVLAAAVTLTAIERQKRKTKPQGIDIDET